jgi:hypothetical protein
VRNARLGRDFVNLSAYLVGNVRSTTEQPALAVHQLLHRAARACRPPLTDDRKAAFSSLRRCSGVQQRGREGGL